MNTKGIGLYNFGFIIPLYDPTVLVETVAILLSAEGHVFRLPTSEQPPICYDLAKIPFAMNSQSVSQLLSHIKTAKVKEHFLPLSKDKCDITYSDLP